MEERIQKLMAAAGLCSRRAAETYLRQGRVTVNGRTAALGDRADSAADEILAGIEEGRNIILVTDTARTAWEKQRQAPESADRWAARYTERNRQIMEYTKNS